MDVQILSYEAMRNLESHERIKKILNLVKKTDLVLLEGKLRNEEEIELINNTMENISKNFTGVEIAYLDSTSNQSLFEKIRTKMAKFLLKDRIGITVIGPSKVVKEIKKDPNKIEVYMK